MSEKMRIAVWYFLPSGGAKRALYHHVEELVKLGHYLEAWRPPVGGLDFAPIQSLVAEHEVPLNILPADERNYFSRVRSFANEEHRRFSGMEEHAMACAKSMKARNFDILLSANCFMYHASSIGRHFDGVKILYLQEPKRDFYEAGERLIWRPRVASPKTASLRSRVVSSLRDHFEIQSARAQVEHEYQNAASYDSILVNSFYSRESVLRAYGISAEFCPLGIDGQLFSPGSLPKEPFVVGLGMVNPRKNLGFAIEAIASIAQNRPKLIWFGNDELPEYRAAIELLAKDRGVDLTIRIMASDEEVVQTLRRATVCVCSSRLEPFGFAPLEANACGTPSVVVAEGGLRETTIDGLNGFVVPPDPAKMGERVAQLLGDPELVATMGKRAVEHVRENWTWDSAGKHLETAIQGAVARRHDPGVPRS